MTPIKGHATAIQGLGRTHRSAQVSAPFFRVCTTNVHGEKRFTSTIARRLDTLGALTKGQRETASQGMFRKWRSRPIEFPVARGCDGMEWRAQVARQGLRDEVLMRR